MGRWVVRATDRAATRLGQLASPSPGGLWWPSPAGAAPAPEACRRQAEGGAQHRAQDGLVRYHKQGVTLLGQEVWVARGLHVSMFA